MYIASQQCQNNFTHLAASQMPDYSLVRPVIAGMCFWILNNNNPCNMLASYRGHVGGGKSRLVSTVCACAKNPTISWGIVYRRLRTVNLYRILAYSSEARLSRAYPANTPGKSEDFDKASAQVRSLLYWKGRFHVEGRAAGCDQMYLRW